MDPTNIKGSEGRVGERGGCLMFAMKVNGHSVCNRCYADATGYSQRQFTNLKQSIKTTTRKLVRFNSFSNSYMLNLFVSTDHYCSLTYLSVPTILVVRPNIYVR